MQNRNIAQFILVYDVLCQSLARHVGCVVTAIFVANGSGRALRYRRDTRHTPNRVCNFSLPLSIF